MGNECDSTLSVNGHEHPLAGPDDLLPHLEQIHQAEYTEIWLCRGSENTALLTNLAQSRAFLMFLTDDNPAGFHAISKDCNDEQFEFLLSNGQMDEHNACDTLPLLDGVRALKHFFMHGGMAPFISWQDDSL